MMPASTVSSPTRVARILKAPAARSVAPVTASPGPLVTGRLSPVRADSFKSAVPSRITPSTGTVSPVFTTTMSPEATSSVPMRTSASSLTTRAVGGASFMSAVTASVVRRLARASKNLPSEMSVTIVAAPSK